LLRNQHQKHRRGCCARLGCDTGCSQEQWCAGCGQRSGVLL
jgi:hypothetical protein